jgi:hypothetical protein
MSFMCSWASIENSFNKSSYGAGEISEARYCVRMPERPGECKLFLIENSKAYKVSEILSSAASMEQPIAEVDADIKFAIEEKTCLD